MESSRSHNFACCSSEGPTFLQLWRVNSAKAPLAGQLYLWNKIQQLLAQCLTQHSGYWVGGGASQAAERAGHLSHRMQGSVSQAVIS